MFPCIPESGYGEGLAGLQARSIGAGARSLFHGPDPGCESLTYNSRERESG